MKRLNNSKAHQNVTNLPFTSGKRQWSHGLLDCGTCVHVWFCPYTKNKQGIEYFNQNGRSDPDMGGSGMGGDCAKHCCLTFLFDGGFILQMFNRGVVRNRYKIEGSMCGDCLTSLCCKWCALTQESPSRGLGLEEQSLMGSAVWRVLDAFLLS